MADGLLYLLLLLLLLLLSAHGAATAAAAAALPPTAPLTTMTLRRHLCVKAKVVRGGALRTSRVKGNRCRPAAQCGMLYFLPEHPMREHLLPVVDAAAHADPGHFVIASGRRRTQLASALLQQMSPAVVDGGAPTPIAVLISRRANDGAAVAGGSSALTLMPVRGASAVAGGSSLEDDIDHFLVSVNYLCHTKLRSPRQLLSGELMREIYSPSFSRARADAIVSRGASIDIRSDGLMTPLMYAAKEGDYNAVLILLSLHADVSLSDVDGRTALHHACESMDIDGRIVRDIGRLCSDKSDCEIDARDAARRTPLHVCTNQLSMVFIDERPTPNDFIRASRILIEELGANVNARDFLEHTPLHLAARRKKFTLVKFLVEMGADLDLQDLQGCSALCHAAEWYSWTVTLASKLVAGVTPQECVELHSFDGIADDCEQALQRALRSGGDVGSADVTAGLVQCGFLSRSAKYLAQAGASLDTLNTRGESPLHIAHPTVAAQLQQIVPQTGVGGVISRLGKTAESFATWGVRRHEVDAAAAVTTTGASVGPGGEVVVVGGGGGGRASCNMRTVDASEVSSEMFVREHVGEGEPLLVLNAAAGSDWDLARRTWGNDLWLRRHAGRRRVETGKIPYPGKFELPVKEGTLGAFLEASRGKKRRKKRRKTRKRGRNEENEVPYLFHNVYLARPGDAELGHIVADRMGNFSVLRSGEFVLETAQFYYGRKGSGAPLHFHGSAVNMLLKGEKQWTLLPPRDAVYSRTHPSDWRTAWVGACTTVQPEGSMLFVPRGWAHAVLNTAADTATVGVAVEFAFVGNATVADEYMRRLRGGSMYMSSLGLNFAPC